MALSYQSLPSPKTLLSAAGYLTATSILLRTITTELVPVEPLRKIANHLSSQLTLVVEEYDGLTANQVFEAANVYLGTLLSPSIRRIKVNKVDKDEDFAVSVDRDQEIVDLFQGVKFKWVLHCTAVKQTGRDSRTVNPRSELRHFEVTFHKKHKDMVLRTYMRHILQTAKVIKKEREALKLHTVDYNGNDYWSAVLLNHPATFGTMAMDTDMKKELIEDLDRFLSRKEYYRRVGKAWKRGYLLYGPPGTGKSSLVAAMANYLKFDVYDLDLKEVQCNSDLRRLLIGTKNRSILVIEDIDCNVGFHLQNREAETQAPMVEDDKITLSGLLNFIDGLWSSCGDERIVVFTTNDKGRLDPALLRPGRMDVHLHMSYCTFSGFKILASNYLKIEEHPLFGTLEELLANVQITPAEVAGELMKSDTADIALQGLVKHLQFLSKRNTA